MENYCRVILPHANFSRPIYHNLITTKKGNLFPQVGEEPIPSPTILPSISSPATREKLITSISAQVIKYKVYFNTIMLPQL